MSALNAVLVPDATIMFVVRVLEQGHFGPPVLLVSKSFEEQSITQ